MLPAEQIDRLVEPFLGGDDPVFGWLSGLKLPQFFDPARTAALRQSIEDSADGLVLIVGCGASLLPPATAGLCRLARWEAQNRYRRNEADNLGVTQPHADAGLQYKRAFFVDWRVCDRWKRPADRQVGFCARHQQTRRSRNWRRRSRAPRPAAGRHRPFRVVPFFDPAPGAASG